MELAEIQERANSFIMGSQMWLGKADEAVETDEIIDALVLSLNYLTKAVKLFNDNINWNQIKE